MGRLAALVLFFLAIAIVVVALQAPASWLAHRLSLAIGESVRVIDTHGTVWDGRGVLASPDGRWKIPVAWHLKAAPLLRGEVEVELAPQEGLDTPRGTLRLARTGFSAHGLVLDLPATVLDSAFAGRAPATFGGEIRIEAREAEQPQVEREVVGDHRNDRDAAQRVDRADSRRRPDRRPHARPRSG